MNTQTLQWTVAEQTAPVDDGRQMTTKGITVDDLLERCAAFDAYKADYEVNAVGLRLQPEGGFAVDGAAGNFTLEQGAVAQLCQRYGKAFMGGHLPRDYTQAMIEKTPADYAPILARHAADYGKNLFVRTYGDSVRALMSDRFTHIDNSHVLGFLKEFLDSGKGGQYELVRPYVGRDELNVRIMVKNIMPPGGDGSAYGVGCVVRTGEVGNVSPAVMPFFQRHACTNSTVWQDGGIKLKQTGNRQTKLMILVAAMGEALQACGNLIERMVAAQYDELPSFDKILGGLAKEFDWSEELSFAVVRGSEGRQTVAGLVNGITWAAHALPMPAPDAIKMEMLGGELLMAEVTRVNAWGK